jgi:hypothetical protein
MKKVVFFYSLHLIEASANATNRFRYSMHRFHVLDLMRAVLYVHNVAAHLGHLKDVNVSSFHTEKCINKPYASIFNFNCLQVHATEVEEAERNVVYLKQALANAEQNNAEVMAERVMAFVPC